MSDSQSADVEPLSSNEQVVLVLVGPIASGKSTFAHALEHHFPSFRRCNQDDLGSRQRVEQMARRCLRQGLSICIDRTNFDALQRSHWINISREFPGTSVWVIVFDCPQSVCASRLRERTGHPTIKNYEHGISVLSRFPADFRYPSPNEGYHHIISLRPSDHPTSVYTRLDISSIIQRLRSSPSTQKMGQSHPPSSTSFATHRGTRSTQSNQSYRTSTGAHNERAAFPPRGRGSYSRGNANRRGSTFRSQAYSSYTARGHQSGIAHANTPGEDPMTHQEI